MNVPIQSILAIYGKESGQGMEFDAREYPDSPESIGKEQSHTELRLV